MKTKKKTSETREVSEHRWDFGILRTLRRQRQWSIADLAERAEVASSVISKLERNCTRSELETLYRLAQAFSMNLSDLLALAEKRTAEQTEAECYKVSGFSFSRVCYRNMRCMRATAPAGAVLARPNIHQEDWEMCWVQSGRILITVADMKYVLGKGDSLQFDALLQHEYTVLEACDLIIAHLKKGIRF